MPVNCVPAKESVGSPPAPPAADSPNARLWRCNEKDDDDDDDDDEDEGFVAIGFPDAPPVAAAAAAAATVAADTGGKFVVLELKEPPLRGLG